MGKIGPDEIERFDEVFSQVINHLNKKELEIIGNFLQELETYNLPTLLTNKSLIDIFDTILSDENQDTIMDFLYNLNLQMNCYGIEPTVFISLLDNFQLFRSKDLLGSNIIKFLTPANLVYSFTRWVGLNNNNKFRNYNTEVIDVVIIILLIKIRYRYALEEELTNE